METHRRCWQQQIRRLVSNFRRISTTETPHHTLWILACLVGVVGVETLNPEPWTQHFQSLHCASVQVETLSLSRKHRPRET